MGEIKKVSDEFSSGGQPSAEALKQLANQGYKSVVNLRSPTETGALSDEQEQAEAVGLQYANVPLNSNEADASLTAEVLSAVSSLPTPVYFHCGAGARGGALALIALATQQKLSREAVIEKAKELEISLEQPHLKQFLESLS
jgi:uncharacterized protein (TIGR01244 family)